MMEEGYRIPTIDEFVQDFEFERKIRRGGGSWFGFNINMSKEEVEKQLLVNRQPIFDEWIPMKVWWKPRTLEEATITTKDESTGEIWTSIINPEFDKPINEEKMISEGKIRVKI
jgi:hypothetical protein